MKNTKTDLRTQKIYDALIEAFTELLAEKPFEKITVRELCEKAKTRTATFYNHFSDKYDFFAFMITKERHDFMEQSELMYNKDNIEEYYVAFLENSFEFVEAHRKMVEHILSDNLLYIMMNSLSKDMVGQFKEHLRKDVDEREIDIDIITQMLVGAMSQCVRWWIEHEEVSKEKIIIQFTKLLKNMPKKVTGN